MDLPRRLTRELQTIRAMVEIYCRDHHLHDDDKQICDDCEELLAYAGKRLKHCPFQHQKPTCSKCPIHCYKNDMRDNVRNVMRYSGPRMVKHHPLLALLHLLDGMKRPVESALSSQPTKNRPTKN